MNVIAVDPGTNGLGVAWLQDGELSVFGLKASGDFVSMIRQFQALGLPPVDAFVGEIPAWYSNGKADPNDLIRLATAVGGCAGATVAKRHVFYKPAEWKGQLPKRISHARILKVIDPDWLTFLEEEKRKYSKTLWADVMDAVGILHFFLSNG